MRRRRAKHAALNLSDRLVRAVVFSAMVHAATLRHLMMELALVMRLFALLQWAKGAP